MANPVSIDISQVTCTFLGVDLAEYLSEDSDAIMFQQDKEIAKFKIGMTGTAVFTTTSNKGTELTIKILPNAFEQQRSLNEIVNTVLEGSGVPDEGYDYSVSHPGSGASWSGQKGMPLTIPTGLSVGGDGEVSSLSYSGFFSEVNFG